MADENPPVETVNVTASLRSPPRISTSSSAFAGKVAISAFVGISNVDTNADVSLCVVSTSERSSSSTKGVVPFADVIWRVVRTPPDPSSTVTTSADRSPALVETRPASRSATCSIVSPSPTVWVRFTGAPLPVTLSSSSSPGESSDGRSTLAKL